MSSTLLFVAVLYVLVSCLKGVVNLANLRHAEAQGVPEEFRDLVDAEKFRKAQEYLAAQTRYGLAYRVFSTTASVAFLLLGGFGWLDALAGNYFQNPIPKALLYFLFLGVLDQILEIPFSWYHTFVLEERFGFNRSTVKTFATDLLKGWILGMILGGLILGAVIWFFLNGGSNAWIWAWAFFTAFQLLLTFLAPVLLMPLFNKFEPLPGGELKSAIENFAHSVNFKLSGIFTMDGSKRSAKANAFFTGLGRFRRIVLFDTLVNQHSVAELVAVLAHEVGHFKKKHIPKQILLSLASSFLMFWLFSLLLKNESLPAQFGFAAPSVQAAFTIAFWLYAPFSLLSGLFTSGLSRKYEFEADAYARETTKNPSALVDALKRLSVENLSNLNPHPWKVVLDYSHPPVVQRIRALQGKSSLT
jgi:STE24 endopeptidase